MVIKSYEGNLDAPLRAVHEDVEREWSRRLVILPLCSTSG